MRRFLILNFALLLFSASHAQTFRHYDFLGAGHDHEVVVTTSSNKSTDANGQKTIDGFPIKNQQQLKDASRFLAQATFGADFPTIEMTAAMGYEAWLKEQFNLPPVPYTDEMVSHGGIYGEAGGIAEFPVWHEFFRSAWITNNLTAPDLLRQRMAFNLNQIMVINDNSDFFEDVGQLSGTFYDMLASNAFGNYQKLLLDVTLSPAMGNFLSHYNNPKEDPAKNIHPDENYAREIMQLFSIGLWELNADGTRRTDAQGQFIPTYSNADIKEFAQVFTGLGSGTTNGIFGVPANELVDDIVPIVITPMKMYDDFHDNSEKQLLNGVKLTANQSGIQDIEQTIEHLSYHPNTAPFISKSLIKMMTTSNPSPKYVLDVASIFDPAVPNNFQEVLKAILLHPEARTCNITENYTFGKLREPVVRLMNYLKAFPMTANQFGDYFYVMQCFGRNTGQAPMESPSVFNFFLPDYQPPGPIGQNYLVGPEFQILNATNAIGLVNDVNTRVVRNTYFTDICPGEEDFFDEEEEMEDGEEGDMEEDDGEDGEGDEEDGEEEDGENYIEDIYNIDYSEELALTDQPNQLVDRLDILLANGLLTIDTKNIIVNAISQLDDIPEKKLRLAIYLVLISPDYAILK